ASKKYENASRVFEQIMGAPDRSIPKDLLDRAEAVAVFPGMIKAGFVVGGRGGSGVISRRVTGGWSAPAFFHMGGASVGLQIGAAKTDLVLLFMNEDALKGLLGDKLEIGGEASAAAGPVGRTASASTNLRLDAGILSYSRSKGLFAGLELKGAVINPDNNLNEALYGFKAKDLLTGANKIKMADVLPGLISRHRTDGAFGLTVQREELDVDSTCEVPLLGRIAAGAPIDLADDSETITVPRFLLGRVRPNRVYALRVTGDSMIDEHICD